MATATGGERERVVITQAVAELIRTNPDKLLYDGKQVRFPMIDVAEDAGERAPGKFALLVTQQDDGDWLVTDIVPEA